MILFGTSPSEAAPGPTSPKALKRRDSGASVLQGRNRMFESVPVPAWAPPRLELGAPQSFKKALFHLLPRVVAALFGCDST